jgi:hypothetical protein
VRLGTVDHCSACGDACDVDWTCQGGTCVEPCGGECPADECCDGRCVDLMTDITNCGECDNECDAGKFGAVCKGGVCYDGFDF